MSKIELFATAYSELCSGNGLALIEFNAKPSPDARIILKNESMFGSYDGKHNVWIVKTADRSSLDASLLATKKAQAKEARLQAPKAQVSNVKQLASGKISTAQAKIAANMLAVGCTVAQVEASLGLASGTLSM